MSWRITRLGDVCDVSTGQSAPQDDDAFSENGHPFIRAGSLDRLVQGDSENVLEKISEENARRFKMRLFPVGTIVFAKSGMSATLGRVYRLKMPSYVVSHLATLIPAQSLNGEFLLRWLEANPPSRLIANEAYPSIKVSEVQNIQIPLPEFSEQIRIADILNKASTTTMKRREAIQLSDDFLRSIYLCTVKNALDTEAPTVSLLDVCSITTGKLDSNAAEDGGEFPFFTCAQETSRINSYAFDCEALLLAGNNASGDYSIKHYKGKFNAYQRTYVLSLNNRHHSYGFFRYAIQSKLRDLKRMSKGTNTKYLTLGILAEQMLVVPGDVSQQGFADAYLKVESQKQLMNSQLKMSSELFSALATRAFNGTL